MQPYRSPRNMSSTNYRLKDYQDINVHFDSKLTCQKLLDYCHKLNNYYNNEQLFKREFQAIPHDQGNIKGNPIRVFQWNIMAQTLGEKYRHYVNSPNRALKWEHRRCFIIEELLKYNPDIICLQEVDHFVFLNRALATQSYSGLFVPKPNSPCLYMKNNNGPDGCAIFYKNNKFRLLTKYNQVLPLDKATSNQVCLLLLLKHIDTGEELCVSTTHLKAHRGFVLMNIRNEQGRALLRFVSFYNAGRPTIICGDFNAEPTEPVYNTMCSYHNLNLDSAYTISGWEPRYNSWRIRRGLKEIMHTVDYIFYMKQKLTLCNLLVMPIESITREIRIPTMTYPSDHFPLVSDFYFQK